MPAYAIKNTASGKYVNVILWDGVAPNIVPAGHTADLGTPSVLAQAQADRAAADAAALSASQASMRDRATDFLLNDPRPEMKALRALALVVLDEINALRTNAALATRTQAQLLNAIVAKITAGSAD